MPHMIGWFLGLLFYLSFHISPIKWAHKNKQQTCRSSIYIYIIYIYIYIYTFQNPHPIFTFLEVFWCGERTMEGGDQTLGNGGSRWNPTKEQINMLESLYKQGLRTPTAEQIQHITARLRDFGHIEGKNVFYWFQNHKARQRQKQKQESFAYYNRFLHATPVFPPYQNVVCSPCYIPPPKNDQVFYHQHPKVQLPTASVSFKRSRITPESVDTSKQQPTRYNTNLHSFSTPRNSSIHHQETLDLFPIHPTGILHHSTNNGTLDLDHDHDHDHSQIKNPSFAAKNPPKERGGSSDDHPFFDFFCGN